MSGMSAGLEANDPTIVSAFHSTLVRQGLLILVMLAVVGAAWIIVRSLGLARSGSGAPQASARARSSAFGLPEPAARRLLRISFGVIWIFDGLLQGQPSMPLGMVPEAIQPTAAASSPWVAHLDNALTTVWSYHPIAAAAAAVWIQIGIGVWLLAAPRGRWSRLAGLASVLWGLTVWVFGEAFGGIFAPGLSWLFGAPGAALLYCLAGLLIALPESVWRTPRAGRIVIRVMGAFFIGMAVLQAWPGRGFWHGALRAGAVSGTLTSMVREMSHTPQPHVLSSLLSSFEGFVAAHGWGVNLFVVIALAAIGAMFLTARPSLVRVAVVGGVVLCLADWVLVEDLGFFGGVGTDPNSMIPMALIFLAGYVAITRGPVPVGEHETAPATWPAAARTWRARLTAEPAYVSRSLAALAALGITLVGAIPMALAATEPHAAPIIAEAIDGAPNAVDLSATPFTLLDQRDQPVSLASLRGQTIALTFLDDVCTSDCPIIAQEFRLADGLLGGEAGRVALIAINANPLYLTPDYLGAFDRQEHLDGLPNWLYLTGSLPQLERVWASYGATVEYSPGGAMIAHSEYTDVIDARGRIRYILDTDPGPATAASKSSFSVTLADALQSVVRSS
jgi:cytochrome oxidase Cu insertion factor (SCO1/SenC/PrrC family)